MIIEGLEKILSTKLSIFIGKTQKQIEKMINKEIQANKLTTVNLAKMMLELAQIDLKSMTDGIPYEANLKCIRIGKNGKPKESTPLAQVDFDKLIEEEWETSFIKQKLSNSIFIFMVFNTDKNDNLVFKGVKAWAISKEDLEEHAKSFWIDLKRIVNKGVAITYDSKKTLNNLPGSRDNRLLHIRPKAKNSLDKIKLPDGQMLTKQAYWINSSYIKEIISGIDVDKQDSVKINEFNNFLSENILSLEDFRSSAKNFFGDSISVGKLLEKLPYKLEHGIVFPNKISNIRTYLVKLILSDMYFRPDSLPNVRYIKDIYYSLSRNLDIIKVEPGLYITSKILNKAGITKELLQDFIKKAFVYSEKKEVPFFTINNLFEDITHSLNNKGFETYFFEDLLISSKDFNYIFTGKNYIFFSNKSHNKYDLLLDYITRRKPTKALIIKEKLENATSLMLSDDFIKILFSRSSYFYSDILKELFLDREQYYKQIYKGAN